MTSTSRNRLGLIETACAIGVAGFGPHEINELITLAARHKRFAELNCNRGLTDAERRREEKIERRIAEIAAAHGVAVRFGGDPRGFTVKLLLPSGAYNSLGGAENGWGL